MSRVRPQWQQLRSLLFLASLSFLVAIASQLGDTSTKTSGLVARQLKATKMTRIPIVARQLRRAVKLKVLVAFLVI